MKILSKIWEWIVKIVGFIFMAIRYIFYIAILLLIAVFCFGVIRVYGPGVIQWLKEMGFGVTVEPTLDFALLVSIGLLAIVLCVTRVITDSWWLCALFSTEICAAIGIWTYRQYGVIGDPIFGGAFSSILERSNWSGLLFLFLAPSAAACLLNFVSIACVDKDFLNSKSSSKILHWLSFVFGLLVATLFCAPFLAIGMYLGGLLASVLLAIVYGIVTTFYHPLSGMPSMGVSDLFYFGYLISTWIFMLSTGWVGWELGEESSSYSYSYSGSSYSGYSGSGSYTYTGLNGEPLSYGEWHALHDELDAVQDAIDSDYSDGI